MSDATATRAVTDDDPENDQNDDLSDGGQQDMDTGTTLGPNATREEYEAASPAEQRRFDADHTDRLGEWTEEDRQRSEAVSFDDEAIEREAAAIDEVFDDVAVGRLVEEAMQLEQGARDGTVVFQDAEERTKYEAAIMSVTASGSLGAHPTLSDGSSRFSADPEYLAAVRRLAAMTTLIQQALPAAELMGGVHRVERPDQFGNVDVFIGGRFVERVTPEQAAEREEAQRRDEEERAKFPYGQPDRLGVVTLSPDDVRAWPGGRWLEFGRRFPDLQDALLKGNAIRFTPPREEG
ncbi:MAG TPA: hypothetical protein VFA08_01320 [Actinomycetota bacterium]|jgi:hypothetical protein|nr:hypothetical protein [Actinomycetota bacterium]